MKKFFLMIIPILSVMLASGCGGNGQNNTEQPNNEVVTNTENPIEENKHEAKIVGNNPPTDTEGFEPVGRYEFDIDGDGEEDTVTLYTSAMRDEKGDMMWDDSHIWLLQAERANNEVNDLFSQRLGGRVYMNVSDYYNSGEEEKVITLIISSNAFHEIREYRYDDTLSGACFTETTVYTTDEAANEGIGNLYSSIPDYE